MGWILFFFYLFYGFIMYIITACEKEASDGSRKKKILGKAFTIWLWLGIMALAVLLLYILGWVWYFFCGGFLVFEDQPFWDKVICGLITLLPLGFFLGIVGICCGWDPDK